MVSDSGHCMKRCYLIRHAQTLWNGENRIQGRSDLPLSPLGEQQAQQLRAFFASRHLKGIFTSHLQRSQQTAQAIAAGNGHAIRPIIEEGLAEMHLGDWEGLTPEEVNGQFRGAYQQWRAAPSSVVIPNAEPLEVFRRRARQVLSKIVATFQEGEYVVVSHGGVIASLLADALGADYDLVLRRLRLDNAGVTALEFGAPLPHVLWINATAHLDALSPLPSSAGWF